MQTVSCRQQADCLHQSPHRISCFSMLSARAPILLPVLFLVTAAMDQDGKSLEATAAMRQVYRSGKAPPPALAPDMSDGSGDYLDYTDVTPEIGARVQPRLTQPQQQGQQQQQQESTPRAQVRGKPRATPIGSVRRANTVFARYRMESIMEVPVATIDSRGRTIPLKAQRIQFPTYDVPQQQQQQQQQPQRRGPMYSAPSPASVRTLQDQVLDPPAPTEPPVRPAPTTQTTADGSQYYVIQNPDGSQHLVIKMPGQPVMMTPLPRPAAGSPPQKYIIRQGPVPDGAAAAVSQAQSQSLNQQKAGIQNQDQKQGTKSQQGSSAPTSQTVRPAVASKGPGSGESTSLQDKYSEKAPDVLINYGNDDLQAGEVGKTLDNGRVRVAKVDPKERQELLQERKETQDRMRNEWEHRLSGDDRMDSED